MKKLTRWVVSRVVPGHAYRDDPQARAKVGLLEGWVSVALNGMLFVLKGVLGLLTGSVSLLADAAHTLSDSLSSVVVIVGFRMSGKPADEKHPFGHGRVESVTAVIIAVLLGVVAVEMFRAAAGRLLHPQAVKADTWVIAVLACTLVLKELLARFSGELGDLIGSGALRADAWHHRCDALSSVLVIAALIGARYGILWLDGAMGIGVAVLIGWAAATTLRDASGPLIGQKASENTYQQIERIARSVPGVQGVHDIFVDTYGSTNIVSLHIEVEASESPLRLHEMSEEIEGRIARSFPGHAVVHVDPVNRDHEHYVEVQKIVGEVVASETRVTSFHDLRIVGGPERFKVVFDVAVDLVCGDRDIAEFRDRVTRRVREEFPLARVVISVEPPYFRNVAR